MIAEQDDPTALAAQSDPADAIEPMSQGRLDLYQGVTSTGASGGLPGGYFLDPSYAYLSGISGCGTGSVSGGTWSTASVAPAVTVLSGTASDGQAAFKATQPMYLYFRHSDITTTTSFEPGATLNWLKTLFYDPCQTGQRCVTDGSATYGPNGPPYIDGAAGQLLLEDAGITPVSTGLPSSYIPG